MIRDCDRAPDSAAPASRAPQRWLVAALAVALFDEKGFSPANLGVQALGTFSIAATTFVASGICFKLIDATLGIRATDREQEDGLDFAEHSANAYADFQITARSN